MKRFFRTWPRNRALLDSAGSAAVEFALVMPIAIMLILMMVDAGYILSVRLRIVSTTSSLAEYAFSQGQTLNAAGVPGFITTVQSLAASMAGLRTPPTVTVAYNNASDASNFSNYYCLAGSPPVWTSTGATSTTCSGSLKSGKFITITVSAPASALFSADPFFGSVVNFTDTAIVRVQ